MRLYTVVLLGCCASATAGPTFSLDETSTTSVVYDWGTFPYTFEDVLEGRFDLTPVHWKRAAHNPLIASGMNPRPVWWNASTIRVFYGVRGPGQGIYYFDVDPSKPDRIREGPVGPIISTGVKGSYDDDWVIAPEPVRLSGSRLRMYYSAKMASRAFFEQAWSLAVAESDDGGKTWVKYGRNPILTTGSNAWERGAVGFCSVERRADGDWVMWYLGTDEKAVKQVGFATSTDGLRWQRASDYPVLPVDPENYWESMAVAVPRVIRDGALYKVWYASFGPGNLNGGQGPYAVSFAESADGVKWSRSPHNPVMKHSATGWDDVMAAYPGVIRNKDQYLMWYSGNGYNGIGFAQASVPRGPMCFRTGRTSKPDDSWSEWTPVEKDAKRDPKSAYIQFAVGSSKLVEKRSSAQARPAKIYFTGDSITAGRPGFPDLVRSILNASFRGRPIEVVSAARSGAKMSEVRAFCERDLSGVHASADTVFIQDTGLTDHPLEIFERELRRAVSVAQPRSVFLINEGRRPGWKPAENRVVAGLDVGQWFQYWRQEANPAMSRVASDLRLRLIDYDASLQAYLTNHPDAPLLETDGVHPTIGGRLLLALLSLRALGFSANELDLSPIAVPEALRQSLRDHAFGDKGRH